VEHLYDSATNRRLQLRAVPRDLDFSVCALRNHGQHNKFFRVTIHHLLPWIA